jgi:hypothetical protein
MNRDKKRTKENKKKTLNRKKDRKIKQLLRTVS